MRKLNQKGSMLIMFTLSFALLGSFVGFALDYGRAYLERARISRLVDAAALAAANALNGQAGLQDEATRAACDSMVMNGTPVEITENNTCTATEGAPFTVNINFLDVSVQGGPPMKHVQVTGTEPVATTFLRFLGWMVPGDFSTIDVVATAQAAPARPVDLMLVLDRSYSMRDNDSSGQDKIVSLKTTVNQFLNSNFGGNDRIGMVSFGSRGCGNSSGGDSTTSGDCTPDVPMDFATSSFVSTLKSRVNGLDANGATNTMESLRTARVEMAQAFDDPNRATTRKAVLLVTDGKPTAMKRENDADCKTNPRNGNPLPSPGDSGSFPSGCKHGATADSGNKMWRQELSDGGISRWVNIPSSNDAQLFRDVVRCTRSLTGCVTNGAMYEANVLRNCGHNNSSCTTAGRHDVLVFAIAVGKVDSKPSYSLDRNAKCLLARVANATDVQNTGNNTVETINTVCANPPITTSDGDTYADLQEGWPCGTGPCINSSQEKGKVYVVDLDGDVEAQLQQVFNEIAAILKLRLTV